MSGKMTNFVFLLSSEYIALQPTGRYTKDEMLWIHFWPFTSLVLFSISGMCTLEKQPHFSPFSNLFPFPTLFLVLFSLSLSLCRSSSPPGEYSTQTCISQFQNLFSSYPKTIDRASPSKQSAICFLRRTLQSDEKKRKRKKNKKKEISAGYIRSSHSQTVRWHARLHPVTTVITINWVSPTARRFKSNWIPECLWRIQPTFFFFFFFLYTGSVAQSTPRNELTRKSDRLPTQIDKAHKEVKHEEESHPLHQHRGVVPPYFSSYSAHLRNNNSVGGRSGGQNSLGTTLGLGGVPPWYRFWTK